MDCFFNDKISIFVPASGIKSSRLDYDVFKQFPNLIITTLVGERDVLNSTYSILWELSRLNYPPDTETGPEDWKRVKIRNRDLKIKLLPITRSDSTGIANRSWMRWRGNRSLVQITSKELEKLYPDYIFAVFTWPFKLVDFMAQAQYVTNLEIELPFYYTGGGSYRDSFIVDFRNWEEKLPDATSLKYSEKLSNGKPTVALKIGRVYHTPSSCDQRIFVYLGKYDSVMHNAWSWAHEVYDWEDSSIIYNDYQYDRVDGHPHYLFLNAPARGLLEQAEKGMKLNYIEFIQKITSFKEDSNSSYYREFDLRASHRKPKLIDLGIDVISGTSDKKDTFGKELLLEYIRQEINFGRIDFPKSTLLYSFVPEIIKDNEAVRKYLIHAVINTIKNSSVVDRQEIAGNIERKARGLITIDEILDEWEKI